MAVATTNTQFSGDGWQLAAAGVNTTTPFQVSIGADLTLKWRYALAASAPAPSFVGHPVRGDERLALAPPSGINIYVRVPHAPAGSTYNLVVTPGA